MHHHLQVLLRAGLVRVAGERRQGRTRWKDYERSSPHIWVEPDLFQPGTGDLPWSHLATELAGLAHTLEGGLRRARAHGALPGETILQGTVLLDEQVARALPNMLAHWLRSLEALDAQGPAASPQGASSAAGSVSRPVRYRLTFLSLADPLADRPEGHARSGVPGSQAYDGTNSATDTQGPDDAD